MSINIVFFIIRRIINAFITLILLIILVFIMIHIIAPNPLALARLYTGPHATYTELEQVAKQYGLDQPLYIQIINYIINVLHGNFGIDPTYKVPVITLIGKYLPRTLELVIPATILSVVIGLFTGAIAASNRNKPLDYLVRGVYLVTWASPPFLIAVILQLVIAYYLRLLPPTGTVNPVLTPPKSITPFPLLNAMLAGDWPYFSSLVHHMVLPVIAIALVSFGIVTRIARASMLDYMESDFAKLSLMKGLSRRRVVYGVVLRNASIPLVTLIALLFGYSVAGAVVIEDIFQYHGMGYFITQAIESLDYTSILGTTIIVGIAIIIANLIADILYGVLDPRVRIVE
ncbi:ABC transporter permease [Saccharolobus solfataricus]|uniref:Dipeptide ABC transporter permease protein (DppB-3) n=3 Tax=Saccharolobus solfataricus TaxID=2287 RepID=Q97VK6_SACS2|nr:ABC transporter permease [Saccharolobus solfataricus]AAK42738.1 Dipeptide ABC transporter permease protein (dppB-3) [Saccharolobus solfataricus P2]AKA72835.1 ABC transporter permease [Saccharolobus solfataricus]AKA75534.1 ABC transporter permease [Saccharolobus solfataricus]AKA78227.1 ABC transporter permease [Saccharolobus solfataricus]AZF67345.1 ABC transporter permease [Saccharolobus solfataricus]